MKQAENLAVAILLEVYGHCYENDPDQEEVVVEVMDWLEGQKLPNSHGKGRHQWVKRMAKEWVKIHGTTGEIRL